MPLLRTIHPFPDANFSLWQIAEAPAFFEAELPLSEAETRELSGLRDRRRMEWLSSRWLLHKTTGAPQRMPLAKDAFSKPFFLDQPDLFCSLSHSHGIVGALTASKPCGCDIQVLVDKMPRIAPKFLSEAENQFVQSFPAAVQFELFHLFWTGKESLYKQYGIKALDFRGHISLEAVQWDGQHGDATGFIRKDDFKQAYHLEFGKVELPSAQALIWAVCL